MKLGCVTIAYREERFISKFIQSMQDRVDEILVLNSLLPWNGEWDGIQDKTASIADSLGATVVRHDWLTEQDQRNAGQDYFYDMDWIIIMDPDEYLLDAQWTKLVKFLAKAPLNAYVTGAQNTYWKTGYIIDPQEDYKQIIAVRPEVRFIDKRVVDSAWAHAPTTLEHFSWARTDEECWRKINSYGHAGEFNSLEWFSQVWQSNQTSNLHPLTPESLKEALRVVLPKELEDLSLWP